MVCVPRLILVNGGKTLADTLILTAKMVLANQHKILHFSITRCFGNVISKHTRIYFESVLNYMNSIRNCIVDVKSLITKFPTLSLITRNSLEGAKTVRYEFRSGIV